MTFKQNEVAYRAGSDEEFSRRYRRVLSAQLLTFYNASELANYLLSGKRVALMSIPAFETLFTQCHQRKRLQFGIRIGDPAGYYYAGLIASPLNPVAIELERRIQRFSESGLFHKDLQDRWHRCRLTVSGDLSGENTVRVGPGTPDRGRGLQFINGMGGHRPGATAATMDSP